MLSAVTLAAANGKPPRQPPKTATTQDEDEPRLENPFRAPRGSKKFEALARTVAVSKLLSNERGERVMYARKHRPSLQKNPVIGGTPITCEEAMALRTAVFGNSVNVPRSEWLRTGCAFREADAELSYGMKAARNGTRGLLSVVQAHVIRHLLFAKREQTQRPEQLLKPNATTQTDALLTAISDILWCVGEKTSCRVCLPQDCSYVEQANTYFQDNITERLHLFEFTDLEDLQIFIKRYIYLFQDELGPGALLLLYSAVFTRGIANVMKDIGEDKGPLVVAAAEEGSHNVVMLLLTGRATPYLHNGVVYVGDEDHYALPQYGVLSRSGVGFLTWNGAPGSSGDESKLPGSRLKTPSLPVWVASCVGHYGVVFNTNRELLCNYHAERRFELHYYTCGGTHSLLSVDTRFNDSIDGKDSRDDMSAPPLEKLVHTNMSAEPVHDHSFSQIGSSRFEDPFLPSSTDHCSL